MECSSVLKNRGLIIAFDVKIMHKPGQITNFTQTHASYSLLPRDMYKYHAVKDTEVDPDPFIIMV